MNRWLSLLLHLLWVTILITGPALAAPPLPPSASQGFDVPHDELSPEAEQAMWEEIQRNVEMLRREGLIAPRATTQAVAYNFPLRLAPGLPDYTGFRVSAFVDHDPNTGTAAVLDYNGGTRTYDTHRGTDYALWPFGWNKVNASEMQVIAAAAGQIVYRSNVDPTDHNPCDGGSSLDDWNAIAVIDAGNDPSTLADDRMTLYGHMRYNSLTSKGVGQMVAQGEYLGTAASSGNSGGPHLHFEVRNKPWSNADRIDPYAPENQLGSSLWASQRPYYDSAINRLSTHSAQALYVFDQCQVTVPNLQDNFTTPTTIRFDAYYRDYQGALITDFKIYRPDGSVFQAWQDVPTDGTFVSNPYKDKPFVFSNTDPAGTWRFTATYNGQTYETFFNVNAPTTVAVTTPNGGEQWGVTLPHTINWTDNLGGDVNIALYRNGVYSTTLAYNTPSDGEYSWTPDATLALGTGYTIRVTSVINSALYDASNAAFTLTPPLLIARDDFALTVLNAPITLPVLSNDTDPNGNALTLAAVGQPLSGTVSSISSTLLYTPTLGFLGSDVFTYTVSASTQTATATVTVLVANQISKLFLPLIRR